LYVCHKLTLLLCIHACAAVAQVLERCGLARVLQTAAAATASTTTAAAQQPLCKQTGLEPMTVAQAISAFYAALFSLSMDDLDRLQSPDVKVRNALYLIVSIKGCDCLLVLIAVYLQF
jgi:hypothetical protein